MGGRRTTRSACDSGFTLAELLVVLAIIAILLVIAMAAYLPATAAATSAACRNNQKVLEDAAAVRAATEDSTTPTQLADLESYVANYAQVSVCPKDGTPLTFNPVTNDVSCPNHP